MYPVVYLCVIYFENWMCNNHVVIMYYFHPHWENLHAHKAGSIMIKKRYKQYKRDTYFGQK